MDNPAVLLLLLEQGNRSLMDHTRDFVHLVPLTHYPDSSLCTIYRAGLNNATKALLFGDGPRESFADYIEWVLVSCRSSLTAEDDTQSPANQHPDTRSLSPSPPRMTSQSHERQSQRSPQSQSPTRPIRCESRLHLP
ncbi:Retrotransposon-like protein 1 [Labeo rohita]|uniref:Retrotransposon-like protein 1 n=1 Tax=Labeo rohita TaxID=84645 RepID=A0ABQ8L014_LABRO|nr:Retrotransposon-like protein 1 [Labeo rohita]